MTTKYTIDHLNAFRSADGFDPVFGLSQRAINQQCREFAASNDTAKSVIPYGDATDYGASEQDRKFRGTL